MTLTPYATSTDGFVRSWVVANVLLIFSTWRLWFPEKGFLSTGFPSVPMLNLPPGTSAIDWVMMALLGGGLVTIAAVGYRFSAMACVAIALCGFFITNQHRLQPWAYLAMVQAIVWCIAGPIHSLRGLRVIAVSVYAYSALGKFDYQFLHTVGQDFVGALFGKAEAITTTRVAIAAMIPVTELGIAIALCIPSTRRNAGIMSMIMHASLVGLLGPWWLGHSVGVILWNVWMCIQSWFLFVARMNDQPSVTQARVNQSRWSSGAIGLVVAFVIAMPLTERSGYWDHWLSWSLYSPHTSRVQVQIHRSGIDQLPAPAIPYLQNDKDADDDPWSTLAIDQWSLAALSVPVYPQARFQLGVAAVLARSMRDPQSIRVVMKSVSNRFDGTRDEERLRGRDEIMNATKRFFFLSP